MAERAQPPDGDALAWLLEGLLQDIARILARNVITEPFGTAVTAGL